MNSRRLTYLLLTFSILLAVFADYYTLQIGCFSDKTNAESLKTQMEEMQLTPVTIENVNGINKVYAGGFDSYLEAKFINDNLKAKDIVKGGFIKRLKESTVKNSDNGEVVKSAAFELFNLQKEAREAVTHPKSMTAPTSLGMTDSEILASPNESLDDLQMHRKIKLIYLQTARKKGQRYEGGRSPLGVIKGYVENHRNSGNSLLQHANVMLAINAMHDKSYSDARLLLNSAVSKQRNSSWGMFGMYQLGLLEIQEKKKEKAFEIFEEMVLTNPENKTAGKAAVRLGYVNLNKKDKRMAKHYFMQVAAGEVKASKLDRTKAMLTFANIAHGERDLMTAYKAFDELAGYTDSADERIKVEVEKAGLLLEGALCQKGSYEDCRIQCLKVLQMKASPAVQKYRARAALMYVESLNYEKLYEESIEAANLYRKEFFDCPMECEAITYWLGENYCAQKNYPQAQKIFATVYDSGSEYTDAFKAFNPKVSALFSGAMASRRSGNVEQYRSLLERIVRDYPQTKEGHLAAAKLKRSVR